MKRPILFLLALAALALPAHGQSFTSLYDFTGQPGSQLSTPVTSGVPLGLTLSALTRGSGVIANALASSMNSRSWGNTFDANDFYELTITPDSGKQVSLSNLTAILRRSGTGPVNGVLRASTNSFATDLATFSLPTSDTSVPLNLSGIADLQNATSGITLRLYGYGASSASGTFALTSPSSGQGLTVAGNLAPVVVSEAPSWLLSLLGLLILIARWRRRGVIHYRLHNFLPDVKGGHASCPSPSSPLLAAPTLASQPSSTA